MPSLPPQAAKPPEGEADQTLISSSCLPLCSGTKNHTPTAIMAISTGIVLKEA